MVARPLMEGTYTGEGLKMAPRTHFLSSCWDAHRSADSVACSLQCVTSKREKESVHWGLNTGPGTGFVRPGSTHGHQIKMDSSQRSDRLVQLRWAHHFPGPDPQGGLVRGSRVWAVKSHGSSP
jgi:hypothetical protein